MKPAADVISRNVGDELVILDLQRGIYFGLDEVGARIWALMTHGADASEIAAMLAEDYDAGADEIEIDVRRLLHELRDEGLIIE